MNKISEYLFKSFTTESGGFAARKLSAFAGICTAIILSFQYTIHETASYIINSWQVFGLICLGLVTTQQIIELKQGKNVPKKEDKPTI